MLHVDRSGGGDGGGSGCNAMPHKPLEGDFLFPPPLLWTPSLTRGRIIWRIILARAKGRAATTSASSIDDRDAGGTQQSYPVLPCPARGAAPLIFCRVVSAVAPLALPRSRKGGS